jgi:acyl-CoA synthetase (AMP-forming)/AMP-acid ligase II
MSFAPLRHELHHGRLVPCHADRPANVFAMFLDAVRVAPERAALVDGERRLSYGELAELAGRCASRMEAMGVAAGDRVGVLLDNRIDFLVVVLAAAALGAVSVPMNIRQRRPETAYALADAGAVLLFHEAALADQIPGEAEVPTLRGRIAVDDEAHAWDGGAMSETRAAPVAEDDPFCIMYTSGTTGRPKGAVLTHLNVVTSCLGAVEHLGLNQGEVGILSVPASHVTGLILVLLVSVRVAGTVVLQRGFKARRFLELAEKERLTYAIMVPAMYSLCQLEEDYDRFDLSAWRVGAYGGAPMPEALVETLGVKHPQLRLVNIYGATETTSPAVMMPAGKALSHRAKLGTPLRYADIRIMGDDGRECAPGEQGEIWMAGPMVIPGYWNNPEVTEGAFAGGYWKSGDLGAIDAEGYLQLFDRKKDMINRGGFKVYSVEVENLLMSHPAVVEVGVVGRPCPVLGERVEAFVVTMRDIAEAELRAYCSERLSDYKVPDHIIRVEGALPRNANGKLLKSELRARLEKKDEAAP